MNSQPWQCVSRIGLPPVFLKEWTNPSQNDIYSKLGSKHAKQILHSRKLERGGAHAGDGDG
jgi:hypothetical protein